MSSVCPHPSLLAVMLGLSDPPLLAASGARCPALLASTPPTHVRHSFLSIFVERLVSGPTHSRHKLPLTLRHSAVGATGVRLFLIGMWARQIDVGIALVLGAVKPLSTLAAHASAHQSTRPDLP